MKSDDLQTDAELRTKLSEAATDLRQHADDDADALAQAADSYVSDLNASAHADLVAEVPAVANALPADRYKGLDDGALDIGENEFEVAFNEARRSLMGAVASGVDSFVAVVLQEAVNAIDTLREATDEIAVEAAQLAAAAASGILVPPTRDDLEDMQDELGDAQVQATLVSREIGNLSARRAPSRVAEGSAPAPNEFPVVRTLPGRVLVRTPAPSEAEDRDDQGISLAAGAPGQTRASVASDQAVRLQELLRAPAIDRVGYILICAGLANLSRSKKSRDKAKKAVEKLRRVYGSLKGILSGSFVNDLQANLEAQAQRSVNKTLTFIQTKIDAIDGFLKVVSGLPGPFVATVESIGDVPDTSPVLHSIASLCGLKGSRFCDLKGLLEVAKSLDTEFGLQVPKPPMIGRAQLTLDPPDASQSPDPVTIPGQEADLLLVSASAVARQVVARFSRADAPTEFDPETSSYRERRNVFGTGGGTLTLLGNGASSDIVVTYTAVSFDIATGNYTFTLAPASSFAFSTLVPTVRTEADGLKIAGTWDSATLFPAGTNQITLRAPEAQVRDLTLPCDLALGFGEQEIIAGQYDASSANTVRALQPAFESWMVGMAIELGVATANGVAESRVINAFIDEQTVTYAGASVAATLPGARGTFRLAVDKFEICRAQSMTNIAGTDLKAFQLAGVTSKPHGRQRIVPQAAVRVVPSARNTFLDAAVTPGDGDVRDEDFLPVGSTVILATYTDPDQDPLFTPTLVVAGSGKVFINGQGPFNYSAVTDQPGAQLRFVLTTPTTTVFEAGMTVEVETTSLLDRFEVDFPDTWFEPIDTWLLGLGAELNRLESKFCRLLSGSNQDIAASAASLTVLSSMLSIQLTSARFLLMAWLVPLAQQNSVTRALERLDEIGARRAVRQVREGRLSEFASMTPAEGTDEGATLAAAQAYRNRVTTEDQERLLAKATAELNGRFESAAAAAIAIDDLRAAQQAEIERRREGARRIEALQEKLA